MLPLLVTSTLLCARNLSLSAKIPTYRNITPLVTSLSPVNAESECYNIATIIPLALQYFTKIPLILWMQYITIPFVVEIL